MPKQHAPLVINLFAGPGAGKSTVAAEIFAAFKRAGVEVELPPEVAKLPTFRGDQLFLTDQLRVFAEQNHYMEMAAANPVEVLVCDSPLLLSLIYAPDDYYATFANLVNEVSNSYRNYNYFIEREYPYSTTGRYHSEREAHEICDRTLQLLNSNHIPYKRLRTSEAASKILESVLPLLRPPSLPAAQPPAQTFLRKKPS